MLKTKALTERLFRSLLQNRWVLALGFAPFLSWSSGGGHHGFSWINSIPGLAEVPNHVATFVLIGVILVSTTFVARLQLLRVVQSESQGLIPDARLSYRNFFEIVAEKLYELTQTVMGEHEAARFFPLIGTLFVYIFVSNLIGLIPGFLPPTDNLNTTLALGLFVFIYYNAMGFKEHGLGYLKHFIGPILSKNLLLIPLLLAFHLLMFLIETISHIVRPVSLGLRLRGNIMGDHMVLNIFNDLVPAFVPMIFNALGLFVCFIQAFVFCLLTMVYISLSTAHDH